MRVRDSQRVLILLPWYIVSCEYSRKIEEVASGCHDLALEQAGSPWLADSL